MSDQSGLALMTEVSQVIEAINVMEKEFNSLIEQLERAIVAEDTTREAELRIKLETLLAEKAKLEKKVNHIVKQTKKLTKSGAGRTGWRRW
ncbi:hypothetical protein ACX1C1_05245 [Paenibacillus sp. strain BS8-2]